jgi:predicted Zn-dependent peptidase
MKSRSLVVFFVMIVQAASGSAIAQPAGQGTAARSSSAGNVAWLGTEAASSSWSGSPQRPTRRQPAAPPPAYFRSIQSREDDGNRSRVVLRNGLTILIEEQTLYPLASIVTLVKGEPSSVGARLLAESLFHPFAEGIHSQGGSARLEIAPEAVLFHSTGPAQNISRLLEPHAGLLSANGIEQFTDALKVLGEKSRPERQTTREAIEGDLRRLAGRPAAPPVGDGNLSGSDLKALHGKTYLPQQMIIAVSGAALREEILERAAALYPSGSGAAVKPSPALGRSDGPAELNRGFAYEFKKRPLQAPLVGFVYRIPGILHEDYHPLAILPHLLGSGRGSLLHRYLVDETQTARSAEAWLEAGSNSGLFFVLLRPDPERVDAAETQAFAQIEVLKQSGVPRGELHRAKAAFLREHFSGLQQLDKRAADLAYKEARGRYSVKDHILERVNRVGERDVLRVLNRYFSGRNLSLLEAFPQESDDRTFTPESFLETIRLLVPSEVRRRVAQAETETARQGGAPGPALSTFTPSYLKHDLRRTSIMRGPTVYLQERHDVPLVHVGMFFTGGRSLEGFPEAGKTEVLLRSLLHSFRVRKGAAAWADLETAGGKVEVVNEAEFFGLLGTGLSPSLEAFFQSMLEMIRAEELEEADVAAAKTEVLHLLGTSGETGFEIELSSIARRLLPSSQIVGSRFGTEETLAELTLPSVQAWNQERLSGFHPLIVVVGDIPGTAFLENFIPTLSDAGRTPVEDRREVRDEEDDENDDDVQPHLVTAKGEVRVAFPGPAKATRDERILAVLAGMLEGEGGKLQAVLREKNLGYGFSLTHRPVLDSGIVVASALAFWEKEEDAGQEIIAQLQEFVASPIPSRDFFNGLVRTISGFFESQQGGRQHLLEHASRIVAGAGVDYEKNFQESVREMTREDVAMFARVYLQSAPPVGDSDSSN